MRSIKPSLAVAVLVAAVAFGAATKSFAHHSFGHYEMNKTAEIEGKVSKFEWSNPHCWLFVDVVSPDGKTVTYGFELQSVGEMLRRGWKKTAVKPGETLKVKFRPMRDGTPAGLLVSAEKNGQRVGNFGGPPPTAPTP